MKYIKILLRTFSMRIKYSAVYSVDTLFSIITQILDLIVKIIFILTVFTLGEKLSIGGFDYWQILLVLYAFEVMTMFLWLFLQPSAVTTKRKIYTGDFDILLLKPVNSFYFSIVQNSWVTNSVGKVIYLSILFPVILISNHVSWLELIFLTVVLCYSSLIYSLFLWLGVAMTFYFTKFDFWSDFLGELMEVSKYPKNIYPKFFENIFLYFLPILLILNPIYSVLNHEYHWELLVSYAIVITLQSILLYFLWKIGIKRYSSVA